MTRFIAVDTETELIADRQKFQQKSSTIYLSPYVFPDIVLGTWSNGVSSGLLDPASLCDSIKAWLTLYEDVHLVFQNAPFDLRVIEKFHPPMKRIFETALKQGRIHDTKVLDVLVRLKDGYFDTPVFPQYETPQLLSRSLKDLALDYLKMDLAKDATIRLNFGQYKGHLERLEPEFREYAIKDAIVTWKVWQELLKRMGPAENFLSEPIQVRCEYAASLLDQKGVRIDRNEARRLRDIFLNDLEPLHRRLVAAGLGEWLPLVEGRIQLGDVMPHLVPSIWTYEDGWMYQRKVYKTKGRSPMVWRAIPVFHLCTKLIRGCLQLITMPAFKRIPMTETGMVSMDAEFWKDHIPADNDGLNAWLEFEKLRKIIGTYLDLYSQVERIYPKWKVLGARSGRWACSSPNVQNIPKRKHGIRSLFMADEGMVYVRADYSCQELLTLAQAMLDKGISGPLLAGIKAGKDLHKQTASLLLGIPEAEVTKAHRQTAKAVNFGVPGGLGPAKLADYAKKEYGIEWTVPQAKETRAAFLRGYPDIKAYLDSFQFSFVDVLEKITNRSLGWWAHDLGCESNPWAVKEALFASSNPALQELVEKVQRQITSTLRTGRVRSHCTFTEGANTGFQGLASDVTKEAVFLATTQGLDVRLVVHDEIVIQAPPEHAEEHGALLALCMKEAFMMVCPDVGPFSKTEVTISPKWGSATDADGKEI